MPGLEVGIALVVEVVDEPGDAPQLLVLAELGARRRAPPVSTREHVLAQRVDSVHSHTSCQASSRVGMRAVYVVREIDRTRRDYETRVGVTRVLHPTGVHPNAKYGKEGSALISVIIAVLFAALVYALCLALGLPAIVGLIAAILVLLAGIPTGGYGVGRRF